MTTTQMPFTTAAEQEAARAIEAGILAAAALADRSRPDVPDADLEALVALGEEATRQLLSAHEWLVRVAVAQEFHGVGSREDLIQQGWLALVDALRRFDHELGRFSTYAVALVRAGVRVAVAREQGRSERQVRGLRQAHRVTGELAQSLGRLPGPDDIAAALGCDVTKLRWCESGVQAASDQHLFALLPPLAHPYDDMLERPDWTELREAVRSLSGLEQRIVAARFLGSDPTPYVALAAELGISIRTARRVEKRALALLRDFLGSAEERSMAA